ncbi:4356_t:CDS:2 [Paraglomus occultum]|uniref:TBP-associated factor 6 n=1 Tax=Paraglomus occultum TaxID=144539 RepID=A0A9N8Z701_9GLOM|nr:4356_t:CDS:2 [Paraglomus occultum]
MAGIFSKETIKTTAEAVGITNINDDVATALSQDLEYRIHEILQEAIKFMRHAKRTKMTSDDIDHAMRVRNVEPLYGFNGSDQYKFQRLTTNYADIYYLEDDELDFENIMNVPLPKVPLDVTFTAHWLAIEGVQPATPQNPIPEGARANTHTADVRTERPAPSNGTSMEVDVRPLVKHNLSRELQTYYEKITKAVLSEESRLRVTALNSLKEDPALHQLLPYFVQFICSKVAEGYEDINVLENAMNMTDSLLNNQSLYMDPYLHQLIPAILSCLVAKSLGSPNDTKHWDIRDRAANLIQSICVRYGVQYYTLQPRICKTLLRAFLDISKPFTTHYGAIVGLSTLGREVVKLLILPNLKPYSIVLEQELVHSDDLVKRSEAQRCYNAILLALMTLKEDAVSSDGKQLDELRDPLEKRIGQLFANELISNGHIDVTMVILNSMAED